MRTRFFSSVSCGSEANPVTSSRAGDALFVVQCTAPQRPQHWVSVRLAGSTRLLCCRIAGSSCSVCVSVFDLMEDKHLV